MKTNPKSAPSFKHDVYIDDQGEYYFYHQIEDLYEQHIDECYEPVRICGYERYQGEILRQIDPIMFREGLLEWIDDLITEHGWTETTMTYEELQAHSAKVKLHGWGED